MLERPRLLQRIRQVLNTDRSYISCFNVGELERQLSETLQIPLLGTDPQLAYWGSKAGSRELFSRCGLAHPHGSALVHSFSDLVEACAELVERQHELQRAVVKLNEGFSGEGNAPDLSGIERGNGAGLRQQLSERLEQLAMPAAAGASCW